MAVTLHLDPETEKRLVAQAYERGVSLCDYLQEIVKKEVHLSDGPLLAMKAGNLSDLLLNSPFSKADLNLERSQDYPRPAELE